MGTAHAEVWGQNGPGTFQKQEKVDPAMAVFLRMLGGTQAFSRQEVTLKAGDGSDTTKAGHGSRPEQTSSHGAQQG